ncbi:MAG: hypothetical protein KAS30_00695 [Candidatus Diapherotrites archaeon]|nr:hypothetical protein [Candidatus Diapherotrites archaeon]
MGRYVKGATSERELMRKFWEMGYASLRVAGSGSTHLPAPDVVAVSSSRVFAFECKNWKSDHLLIKHKEMNELEEWADRAEGKFYIAWKIPHKGWFFLKKYHFNNTGEHYCISKDEAMTMGDKIEIFQ